MKKMLRTLASLSVIYLLSISSAHAYTVNANKLAPGTEVRSLGYIGEFSILSGTSEKAAYIERDSESQRNTIGPGTGNLNEISACNTFLCGRPKDNISVGLLIELLRPINLFSFKGFDRSSDSFEILFFDANDALIEHQHPSEAQTSIRYYDCGNNGFLCPEYNYDYKTNFDLSEVRKIYFGGSSAAAYVTEISVEIP